MTALPYPNSSAEMTVDWLNRALFSEVTSRYAKAILDLNAGEFLAR